MRIGVVPYVNALPLYHYFDQPIIKAPPADLEKMMLKGELDLALLPIFSLLQNPQWTPHYDAGIIGSNGPVDSVCVFYKNNLSGPEKIKSIKYSTESRTSIHLFKVLVNIYLKQNFRNLNENSSDPDAELIIGDAALFFEKPNFKKWDLGSAWTKWTGLPFVYATWVSQKPVAESLISLLKNSRDQGLKNIPTIVSSLPKKDQVQHYLTKNIEFVATPFHLQAINLFCQYCKELGLV